MDRRGEHFHGLVRVGYFIGFVGMLIVLWAGLARADYDGPAAPEIQQWFRSVRNAVGEYCCDGTEVAHVSDYQWHGDHFEIVVDTVTYKVPPKAVSPEPNRLGDALVWFYPKGAPRSEETLRCFMRGTEG